MARRGTESLHVKNKKYSLAVSQKISCRFAVPRFGFVRHIFIKISNSKYHGNASSGSRVDTYGQTEGRTTLQSDAFSLEGSAFMAV